jgi:OOP family OmpA-OmpF porin
MKRIVVPGLAVLLLVTGCSSLVGGGSATDAGPAPRPDEQRCGQVLTDPTAESTVDNVTVMLADGSASTFAHTGAATHQDWAGALSQMVPRNGHDYVAMGIFGGDVDWKFSKVSVGKSQDAGRTKNDLDDAHDCLVAGLTDTGLSPPAKPQTDVLRALAEAADYVRDRPGKKTIYIATDGLSNTGCADLRAAPIGDLTAIGELVSQCEPELPNLHKSAGGEFEVHFIGIGNSAAGWSDVKTPERTWLNRLWKALCDATGASCVEPLSAAPGTVPASGVTLPDDADVPMPTILKVPGNPTTITVPSSILFDVDSFQLATGRSQDALEEVSTFLKSVRYKRIEIYGHTDSTGTPEHNQQLSLNRAKSVADALTARGFPNITWYGKGSTRPACTPEYRNGAPDRLNMACNRRVEILVYT